MLGDLFLNLFDTLVDLMGAGIDPTAFNFDFSLIDSAFYYINLASWFLPMPDILTVFFLLVCLNNFQVVIRLFHLVKGFLPW